MTTATETETTGPGAAVTQVIRVITTQWDIKICGEAISVEIIFLQLKQEHTVRSVYIWTRHLRKTTLAVYKIYIIYILLYSTFKQGWATSLKTKVYELNH